jgi:apolipoprotein N-acyltransferase
VNHFVLAALGGGVAAAGFAPLGIFPLPILSLALLFWLWGQAASPRISAWVGFSFGLGLFGAGVGWIYVALHDYGYMPMPLALLATSLFSAFLALFPALAGYLQAKVALPSRLRTALLFPSIWVAIELLRGYIMTGFPWLTLGYSQVPDSPLAGYAPIFGVYGVSLVLAASAGLLVWGVQQRRNVQGKAAVMMLAVLWLGGWGLQQLEWSTPQGEPVKVSLLQGNIGQDAKFEEGQLVGTLETYRRLAESSDARLIVLPETALPILRNDMPESYADMLREHARRQGGDVLIGAFEQERGLYYNSMFSLGSSASQSYRKNHMVPFGEFIPLRPVFGWLINEVLNIPMGDLSSGGTHQPLLNLAGQHIAMNICYEDVFGEEIIRALPQATLLLNTSNDAWYGDSHAAMQHNQISQMRALETGRMMLRATNTGVTSAIGSDGRIRQMLPQHREGVLTVEVQGYAGATPYVRWGNTAVLALLLAMFAAVWKLRVR